ncbi:phage scaffolding protein [Clostridioides difficile]
MDLKELLGEDLHKQVSEKLGDKKLVIDDGSFISKEENEKIKGERDIYKTQVDSLNKDLKDIIDGPVDAEKIKTKITDLQTDIQTKEIEMNNNNFNYALREALKDAGCIDSKALEVYLNKEELKLEENKIIGLDAQLPTLKESKAYLFGSAETESKGTGGLGGFKKKTEDKKEEYTIGKTLGEEASKTQNAYAEKNPYFD